MSFDAHRYASRLLAVPLVAGGCLFWGADLRAQTIEDLPDAQEPWLAEPGDWAADFNDAQLACYQGSMRACDSIWLNERVLLDTFLDQYGRSCGGRLDLQQVRRLNARCTEIFPGHE